MTKNLFSKTNEFSSFYKGFFWTIVDISSLTVVYVATKLFLSNIPFPVFGFFWFSAGIFWNLLLLLFSPEAKRSLKTALHFPLFLFIVGLLDAIATIMWFLAINYTANPSIVSFMTNISPIYALLLGMSIHKERFTSRELFGLFIIFIGVVVVSYAPSLTFHDFLFKNAGIILVSSFLSQLSTAILKFKISSLHPVVFAINRLVFLLGYVVFLLVLEPNQYKLNLSLDLIALIGLASFFGPFLSTIAKLKALSFLKMGIYSFLQSFRSIFVLIASFAVFHHLPLLHQVIGGLASVVGIVLLSSEEKVFKTPPRAKK